MNDARQLFYSYGRWFMSEFFLMYQKCDESLNFKTELLFWVLFSLLTIFLSKSNSSPFWLMKFVAFYSWSKETGSDHTSLTSISQTYTCIAMPICCFKLKEMLEFSMAEAARVMATCSTCAFCWNLWKWRELLELLNKTKAINEAPCDFFNFFFFNLIPTNSPWFSKIINCPFILYVIPLIWLC